MEVLKIWDWAMQDWTLVDEWAGMDNEGRHWRKGFWQQAT